MKPYLLIILLFIDGCEESSQVDKFSKYLGSDEFQVLDKTISSFDHFLATNYDSIFGINDRTIAFLRDFEGFVYKTKPRWVVDSLKTIELMNDFESSGLRKELWIYDFEEYANEEVITYSLIVRDSLLSSSYNDSANIDLEDIDDNFENLMEIPTVENSAEPIKNDKDTFRRASQFSKIIVGLHKYSSDELIREYCEVSFEVGRISPLLIANAFINHSNDMDYESFFVKTVIVTEFYYYILFHTSKQ